MAYFSLSMTVESRTGKEDGKAKASPIMPMLILV